MASGTPDKLLVQANQLYERRRFDEAERLAHQALQKKRTQLDALVLLARIDFDKGQHAAAAEHLRRALKIQTRNKVLWFMLAQTLHKEGQLDEAMEAYGRVLRLEKDHLPSIVGQAGVHERRGDTDAALALLTPLLTSDRADASVAHLYAKIQYHARAYDDAIDVASRFTETNAEPGVRRNLNFVLGQAYEKAGRFDDSFTAYSNANALLKRPFNQTAARNRYADLQRSFSADRLAELPIASNDSELPVLVIGMPRSGTTLVERVLDAHGQAHGGGELDFMPQIADNLPTHLESRHAWPECIDDLTPDHADRLANLYLSQLRALNQTATRVVDKQLGNDQAVGLASRLIPKARVIWCHRDPVDTCLSCFAHPLSPTLHPYAADLESLGLMYRLVVGVMTHWREVAGMNWLDVSYEDIVAEQEATSRKIVDFCGLDWDDACLQYHSRAATAHTLSYHQVRQPIYNSSVGRADAFGAHLDPLRAALRDG